MILKILFVLSWETDHMHRSSNIILTPVLRTCSLGIPGHGIFWGFSWFPALYSPRFRDSSSIRTRPITSKSFPVQYSSNTHHSTPYSLASVNVVKYATRKPTGWCCLGSDTLFIVRIPGDGWTSASVWVMCKKKTILFLSGIEPRWFNLLARSLVTNFRNVADGHICIHIIVNTPTTCGPALTSLCRHTKLNGCNLYVLQFVSLLYAQNLPVLFYYNFSVMLLRLHILHLSRIQFHRTFLI